MLGFELVGSLDQIIPNEYIKNVEAKKNSNRMRI